MNNVEMIHTAPFLSVLIGEIKNTINQSVIHEDVLDILRNDFNEDDMITIYKTATTNSGEAFIEFTPYSVKRNPSWLKLDDIYNIENHLFVSIKKENYIALYFSEKGLKDSIRDLFSTTSLAYLKTVDISYLNYLFINEDNIKMLWLLGIHGKNSFKADSKVLGGNNVVDTLDPLEDQSYMMSAVRTTLGNSDKSIGLNPFKSSVWRGPCRDWNTFENNVIDILDLLNSNSKKIDNPISILATPINELNQIKTPYDLSFIDHELLLADQSLTKKDLLRKIKDEYTWEVLDYSGGKEIDIRVYNNKSYCGRVIVEPTMKEYDVSFNVISTIPEKNKKKYIDDFKRVFNHPELLKCWYESGHAIVNSWLFKTDYRDVNYNNFIWADFENYDITTEKPSEDKKLDLNLIGQKKSLFCWVKNRWWGGWVSRDKFNTTEKPSGWLYCDDGAGEKADFIHILETDTDIFISLIHVKAANSNSTGRKISVGAHDIVLNQAVKNLRYANRKNLLSDLKDRVERADKKQCWTNDKRAEPEKFIEYLDSINTISNIKTRVVVIQPHTIKSCYEKVKSSNIKRQLDVLLVSADNAIRASGSEFHIIGFHD